MIDVYIFSQGKKDEDMHFKMWHYRNKIFQKVTLY